MLILLKYLMGIYIFDEEIYSKKTGSSVVIVKKGIS